MGPVALRQDCVEVRDPTATAKELLQILLLTEGERGGGNEISGRVNGPSTRFPGPSKRQGPGSLSSPPHLPNSDTPQKRHLLPQERPGPSKGQMTPQLSIPQTPQGSP